MDSSSWTTTIFADADRSWSYKQDCYCDTRGTPASYNSSVFIIDDTCLKEKTESVPLTFKLGLKPLHHSSWAALETEPKNPDQSSAINENSFEAASAIADSVPVTREPVTEEDRRPLQHLSKTSSEGEADYLVNSCSSSVSTSISDLSSRPHILRRRSNSYPLYEASQSVIPQPIRPGNSCGQLLVKTSYIPRQFQTFPQETTDQLSIREVTGFVLSKRRHRMKERYISLGARILSLFTLGAVFAVVLNFLQKQKNVTVFSPGVFGDVLNCEWWMLPVFGIAAAVIGLLYPLMDKMMGNRKALTLEWSNVMRCIAVFVGINHVTARINFESNIHLAMTLAVLSLGLWYFFDKSLLGLLLCILGTGVATIITQLLVAANVFGYSNPDFLYMRSWVPCLYFSGGITVGVVGRALAKLDSDYTAKEHQD